MSDDKPNDQFEIFKGLKEAREIGELLRQKYNVQPATDPQGRILPPPTVFDIKLSELGKGHMQY